MSTPKFYDFGYPTKTKAWIGDMEIEDSALQQLRNLSSLPFVAPHIAVMPDVHMGYGSAVGSVIPTYKVIIPSAVGVDIGCGMMAVKTTLTAEDLPDSVDFIRAAIEKATPHGRTNDGQEGDRGAWGNPKDLPGYLLPILDYLVDKYPHLKNQAKRSRNHMGTLGTGNHFIEMCLDEKNAVWIMLHSGSRGIGNAIGTMFTNLAREEMKRWHVNIPDRDLGYFPEGTQYYSDYIKAVNWAQEYARLNRNLMMEQTIKAISNVLSKPFTLTEMAINCHHNYVEMEHHFGQDLWITRKGAVRARVGDYGIIPGSMGAKSFIVRGKGNPDSFCSCSHGAGRRMSRGAAKKAFTLEDHAKAVEGVSCRVDNGVLDETPGAYKDIYEVMQAQSSLVEIVHTLKQFLCVKG